MTRRLARLCIAALAAGVLLAPPAARAFTFEDGNKGSSSIPKFDLEEQAKQFRTPQLDASSAAKQYDTPFGKLQFGVDQNSSAFRTFGPSFGSSFNSNADRRHYERMFTPEYLQGGGRGPN